MTLKSFVDRFLKYIICLISALIMILGIIMLSVGGLVLTQTDMYKSLIDHGFFSIPALLIFMGSVITFMFFLGCCGMLKANTCMTYTFAALMTVLFVMGLGGSITAYVMRDNAEGLVNSTMSNAFLRNDNETMKTFEAIEKDLHCCGVNGSADYKQVNMTIPQACCKNTSCIVTDPANIFPAGCGHAVYETLSASANLIISWNAIVLVIELLIIVASCYLARSFRQDYETV